MKNKIQIIIVSLIVFLNAALIAGQEKTIEKANFLEITAKAEEKLEGKTYRKTTVNETFVARDSKPLKSSKTIFETIPPDRTRWIRDDETGKLEAITIGAKRYIRKNGGEWKENYGGGVGNGIGCGARIESESYTVIENTKLDGKTVNLYEMKKKLTNVSCGEDSRDQVWLERYWITKDGMYLKTEDEYEYVGEHSFRRSTAIYEYDPNIKIEAPVLSKETKP